VRDLLEYGRAIERIRERRGMTREALARASGVSYSYLSEVERGLKRPSTDVLVKLATALELLPSELLRQIEEESARGRGLLRRRVLEAPMQEHPGWRQGPPGWQEGLRGDQLAEAVPSEGGPERRREVQALIDELLAVARGLPVEDLRVLLEVARRLQRR